MRPALALADAAQVLLDHRRWPGRRARVGRGRAGRPSTGLDLGGPAAARRPRRQAARRARPRPPGSGAAGSTSSISIPMTGRTPAATAAVVNRTTPYSPS